MTSVASSFSGPQLFTLSTRYGVHEETVLAGPCTTLKQLAQLLRRGGGWDGGHLYSWRMAPPPKVKGAGHDALIKKIQNAVSARYSYDDDFEKALAYESRLWEEAREGKRLHDCNTELDALADRGTAWPLRFEYDRSSYVELELISRRPLRGSDDADSLPRFLAWQPLPPPSAGDEACFDVTFPSLVALARGAGRGFALGCGVDECGTVAAVWTPARIVCSDGLLNDEVDKNGAPRDARPLAFTEAQLHARLAHMERRCAAARAGKKRRRSSGDASSGSDSDEYQYGDDDGEESGDDDDEENDEFIRELSQSLTPQPSPSKQPPSKEPDLEARVAREIRRHDAEYEAVAKAAAACAARRAAAKAARLAPPSPSQPPPQQLRFCTAFPAITALLCADGGEKRYWLFYANRQLRLFRGLWRGERGVLNLGMRKAPFWKAPARHARVHDALVELETHLRQRTGTGRAVAAAERRAAAEERRAARVAEVNAHYAAKQHAAKLKAIEKAKKLAAKQQRAIAKAEAAAARQNKRMRYNVDPSSDGA